MSIKIELFDPAVPSTNPSAKQVTFAVEEYTREIVEVYAPSPVQVGGGGGGGDSSAFLEHINSSGSKHAAANISMLSSGLINVSGTTVQQGIGELDTHLDSVETLIGNHRSATGIKHSGTNISLVTSGLVYVATANAQGAIEELDGGLEGFSDLIGTHTNTTGNKHAAGNIGVTATGAIVTGTVQSALAGLDTRVTTGASNYTGHTNSTGAKHAADNISTLIAGAVPAGTVQTAILNLDGRATTNASNFTAHTNATGNKHAAANISTVAVGALPAATVQGAIGILDATSTYAAGAIDAHTNTTGNKHAAANISFAAGGTLSAGTVQSGIVALDTRVTSLQKPTTYTTALTSERERVDLNFTMATTSSDLKVIFNNSKKVSWDNEWGALRGTSPYSWGDSLVRGIRENSDGITNGQFLQLEDRRTGAGNNVMFGVNWTDGSIVRNGNKMADVWYRANASVTIPANLPAGTIVITGAA